MRKVEMTKVLVQPYFQIRNEEGKPIGEGPTDVLEVFMADWGEWKLDVDAVTAAVERQINSDSPPVNRQAKRAAARKKKVKANA